MRLRPTTLVFLFWLIGWPTAILSYRTTNDVCGPGGLGPGQSCTTAEDYYPTLIFMVAVWFVGLIVAGGVWFARRIYVDAGRPRQRPALASEDAQEGCGAATSWAASS